MWLQGWIALRHTLTRGSSLGSMHPVWADSPRPFILILFLFSICVKVISCSELC